MTFSEFFGCSFIAFGPPLLMFIITIARDPLRIIVCVASAFFWLISLLLSAAWWKAVVPLQEHLAFGLVFSVIFQECFRFLLYLLLRKAEIGLQNVWQIESLPNCVSIVSNKSLLAYVAGFGIGLISGIFSLVNILATLTGPGTVGHKGDIQNFLIVSAFLTLAFILLNVFWGVVFFDGCRKKKYYQPIMVFLSHMFISFLTLLNKYNPSLNFVSLIGAYVLLLIFMVWAFIIAGGKFKLRRT